MRRAMKWSDGYDPMSEAEMDFLASAAVALPDNAVVVNIGAADGLSVISLLEGNPNAVIFSVDVDSCEQETEHIRQAGLDPTRVIRLLGRSQDIGAHFPYPCDFLFIDGGHDYASVKGDILVWLDKVKPGCIFAFHDYIPGEKPANNPAEVDQAVQELVIGRYEQVALVDRIIAFRMPTAEDRAEAWFISAWQTVEAAGKVAA